MVVESEHRNGLYGGATGWREKTLPVFVGILCSGNGLREINDRSFASACRAGNLNRRATGKARAKKRPGPQWKACTRLSDSFPSLVTANLLRSIA
jgi:hypothetical protein